MGILQYFPGKPRKEQADFLLELERLWDSHDVFAGVAPTGAGKTKIAVTIAAWSVAARSRGGAGCAGAWYGHPTNVLLEQFLASPDARPFGALRLRDAYRCVRPLAPGERPRSCGAAKSACGDYCKPRPGRNYFNDPAACPYMRDLRGAHSKKVLSSTWHMRMAHRLVREVCILDEAHGVEDFLADLDVVRVWPHLYGSPEGRSPTNAAEARAWLDAMGGPGSDKPLNALESVLSGADTTRIVQCTAEEYRGRVRPCLALRPVDVSHSPNIPWRGARKVVLLSGTLSPVDVRRLGLTAVGRVAFLRVPSPIPAERRPVILHPVADMSKAGRDRGGIRRMAEWLLRELLPAHAGERGLIHATYDVARELRRLAAADPEASSRLRFHERDDRAAVVQAWLSDSRPDAVLVGSGLAEGLDLPGDLARFQVVTSAPRGNLTDPVETLLAERDPEAYRWRTARTLVQQCGRVVRGPEDYGVTIIADSSVLRPGRGELAQFSHEYPDWFRDALQFPDSPPTASAV